MGRLEGKAIVVTGAAQHIGEVYAHHLAEEGAAVVIADVLAEKGEQVAAAIRDKGGRAVAVHTDVSKRADTERMAATCIDEFGSIDVLVNNAAIFAGIGMNTIDEITEESWDRVMAVNAKGPWLCTVAVLPQMRAQGYGRIVNVASSIANIGPPLFLHYTASKGAVQAMTRSMAQELGDDNIRVTGLSPGMCFSGALESVLPDPVMGDFFIEGQVIKEQMKPDHLAPLLAFLCSDDSSFIIGQNYICDGGYIFN